MTAGVVTLHFTKRVLNPISLGIRVMVPRSLVALALSSHCIVEAHGRFFEAHMLHGVREVEWGQATSGATVVTKRSYEVPDADAGLAFLVRCATKKVPYDWKGALCLGLSPGRDWREDDMFFCYELGAATLHAAGRLVFENINHVGETALLAIDSHYFCPSPRQQPLTNQTANLAVTG